MILWYFSCFLILSSMESLTDNVVSHEATDHYLKKFTFSSR